jgi:hypothetical protein
LKEFTTSKKEAPLGVFKRPDIMYLVPDDDDEEEEKKEDEPPKKEEP